MFFSHPESNLTNNISVLGADIIEILRKKESYVIVDTLHTEFLKRNRPVHLDLFLDALTFLYVVNLVELRGYKIKLRT